MLDQVVKGAVEGLVRGLLSRRDSGDPSKSAGIVEAQSFVLRDGSGKGRAILTLLPDGPGLLLLNEREQVQAMLWLDRQGTYLSFRSEKKPELMLRVQGDVPELAFYDAQGTASAALRLLPDGPRLELWDRQGKRRADIAVDERGPALTLFDANEVPQAEVRCPE
jgi:hypothetical protein